MTRIDYSSSFMRVSFCDLSGGATTVTKEDGVAVMGHPGAISGIPVPVHLAGFEGKQVQVCDPGNVQDYDYGRLQQLVDKKYNG
jgi:hypothetical protein